MINVQNALALESDRFSGSVQRRIEQSVSRMQIRSFPEGLTPQLAARAVTPIIKRFGKKVESHISGANWYDAQIDAQLVAGGNVIAVSVYGGNVTNGDVKFAIGINKSTGDLIREVTYSAKEGPVSSVRIIERFTPDGERTLSAIEVNGSQNSSRGMRVDMTGDPKSKAVTVNSMLPNRIPASILQALDKCTNENVDSVGIKVIKLVSQMRNK